MRVCSNCFAEGIEEEVCPFCGQTSHSSLPSIKDSHTQNLQNTTRGSRLDSSSVSLTSLSHVEANAFYVGQSLMGRYTIQQVFGEKDNYCFYQAIDHQYGRECIIRMSVQENETEKTDVILAETCSCEKK